MARGGRRRGLPGKNYSNRSDLQLGPRKQPVQAPSGLPYGERKAVEDAQRAVPVSAPGVPAPTGGGVSATRWPIPGSLGPLDRPTERPGEPVTTGLSLGPGAGPEVLERFHATDDEQALNELRALYLAEPSEALREILEEIDDGF